MKEFDKYIKQSITKEEIKMSPFVSKKIETALEKLPEKELGLQKKSFQRSWIILAASFAFFLLCFMPNVSVSYAQTMKEVPIIGDIIKVFTIQKEIYEDGHHELNVEIPKIDEDANEEEVSLINKGIQELTNAVIQKFYDDIKLSPDGYGSIYIDYKVITNDTSWFTLKLNVEEVTGSSNSYAKFYHIDRERGVYVQLKDILSESQRKEVEIYLLKTMKEQMENNENIIYFINNDMNILHDNSNFYYNENRDLVIVYNKYDIAPGYMGNLEFVIPREVYIK